MGSGTWLHSKEDSLTHSLSFLLFSYILKSSVLWDMTLCIALKVERRFGGTWRFCLYDRPDTTFYPKTSIDFQRTRWSYQKLELFVSTVVRTANPAFFYLLPVFLSSIFPLLLCLILLAWSKILELTCCGLPYACWHPSYKKVMTLSSPESELLTCALFSALCARLGLYWRRAGGDVTTTIFSLLSIVLY